MKRILAIPLLLFFAASLHAQFMLKNFSLTDSDQHVLYIGVTNELKLEGMPDKKNIEIIMDGRVFEEMHGFFPVMVSKPGTARIDVYQKVKNGKQLLLSKVFQVQTLAIPSTRIAGSTDSLFSAAAILVNPQLDVFFPGSVFKSDISVLSFSITITDKNGETILEETSSPGNRLTAAMIDKVKILKPGDKLFFDNIRAVSRDGRTIKMPAFSVYVR
jgi:hypothetical protein